MQILDNVLILILPVIAFFLGKKISDDYNNSIIQELQYQIRLRAAEKGTAYVAPPSKRAPIGQVFMDKLNEQGRATQKLSKSNNS